MKKKIYTLALYSRENFYSGKKFFTLEEISRETGLHPSFIKRCIDLGIVSLRETEEDCLLFEEDAIYRLRRIQRIRNDLGINLMGAGIISDLMDEIKNLEGKIERLLREKGG